jgi:hypothetical protein
VQIALSAAAIDALVCAGLEAPETSDEIALALAWQGGKRLTVTDDNRAAIIEALTEASNSEDCNIERAETTEERRAARRACVALYTLATRVRKADTTESNRGAAARKAWTTRRERA